MRQIYLFSGPCGSGKTTLANAYAEHLVRSQGRRQVYVIHGDDFHRGLVETEERVGSACPGFLYWPDILRFNWECMLSVAEKALARNLDVVMDYVVEDELPFVCALARRYGADLFYVVLTASPEKLTQRLTRRGSAALIERALFLKAKLDSAPDNQGHLYDTGGQTVSELITGLRMAEYAVSLAESRGGHEQ